MEPEAVVSLSGVLAKQGGQMVLAGDPKQLGPVTYLFRNYQTKFFSLKFINIKKILMLLGA